MLFLYTVAEMEADGLDLLREITEGASAGAEDLREVAVELLSRLQSRALSSGKRVPLDVLARKIIDSRSCNLKANITVRRSRTQDAERPGRTAPMKRPEWGRATKMRLTTGRLNHHQNDREEWCAAAGREISTPRTDPDASGSTAGHRRAHCPRRPDASDRADDPAGPSLDGAACTELAAIRLTAEMRHLT
ncbi:hypothetical protein GS486_18205 [Rhodococcus hoagii]|nr:hypothetical protein [Prescottella equi]